MSEEEKQSIGMAECGACRAIIPIDSEACPECSTSFSGVSEDALGECGACKALVPLDSTRCPECGVLFVADDVVDIRDNPVLGIDYSPGAENQCVVEIGGLAIQMKRCVNESEVGDDYLLRDPPFAKPQEEAQGG